MVAAVRQQVTAQPGGVIEIRSADLRPGARADVIVLVVKARADTALPPARPAAEARSRN